MNHIGRITPESGDQPEPADIDVDRERGVTITWNNEEVSHFGLLELRINCPCAECLDRRAAGETVWPRSAVPAALKLVDARLVGAYGMSFEWHDGHRTGIYTWETLHRWSSTEGA